ncbi:hypothetical protein LY90DRAFT_708110 [Neocallimastix californiae]|uniref:SH3 domain-containing protein n=1 Tax=Neocallimastix californiae TaxID=1754190 RepID=A0A1Y2ABL2_9FUNG|nr:hypothetical protein LY90DRAFT_708110 [Neocallimastix californiae]|eukprot:ORY19939.1 hypothetical protein LY90DRAFT_708110 [Neocallimastix californiae]
MIINLEKSLIIKVFLYFGILISKINGDCIKLTGSKSCPSYTNYSIDTTNGIFPLNSHPKYTDVASFDQYVVKYAEFLAEHFVTDLAEGSTCQIAEMKTFALENLRYLTTFACNYIINSKQNTCNVNKPKICKDTCNDFVNSYQGLVNKYNTCLKQETVSKEISVQNSRCTKENSNFNGSGDCINSSNEGNCVPATTSTSQKVPTGVISTVATATTKTANVNSASNSGKEAENDAGDSNKIWIIVGTCCAFLLVGTLIYFYRRGESLDNGNNNASFYDQENRFPPFQSSYGNSSRGFSNNSSGYNGGITSPGMGNYGMGGSSFGVIKNNYGDDDDVLVNRTEMNNIGGKTNDDNEFNFGGDVKNFNFTSNVTPSIPISNANNTGFNNAGVNNTALYGAGIGIGAGAMAGAAAMGMAGTNNNNNEKKVEVPQPQMVNMTSIQPPESQNGNETSQPPAYSLINNNSEPKPQMVNMTSIQPPESQNGNETSQPPTYSLINNNSEPKPQIVNMTNIQPPESQNRNEANQQPEIKIDEEPKAQMVKMTEIPEPEIQQKRDTKFLSTYSEAPDNQRISSQYYGESETSFDFSFSSSKLNIPSQLDSNHLSVASSAMFSSRMSTTSTYKELNSTPYRAVHTYEPQLNDELLLEIGDVVEVVNIYDDGWVWGINTRTNESGACPMLCLEKIEGSETDTSMDERMKSIISTGESIISRDSVPGRRDSRILRGDSINK